MKSAKYILLSVALAASVSAARAADWEEGPAPFDWSGAYIGVQGGYVWTNIALAGAGNRNFNGPTLGVHAGANWQMGQFVLGVEGDVNYVWNSITAAFGGPAITVGTDWQGALRARFGYALDRTLIYGAGGVAITHGYARMAGAAVTQTFTGWTIAAGVEHAFGRNWTARAEYRYADYGSGTFGLGIGSLRVRESALRIGASYHF